MPYSSAPVSYTHLDVYKRQGQLDTVILSAEQYQALKANHDKASRAVRKKAFEAQFGDWIAAQNARFETQGIPGADLRPW